MDRDEIARERILILFNEADKVAGDNIDRANKYVERALDISMSCRVSIPDELKRRYCDSCKSYLKIGLNARKRIEDGRISITCGECGEIHRIPYR